MPSGVSARAMRCRLSVEITGIIEAAYHHRKQQTDARLVMSGVSALVVIVRSHFSSYRAERSGE